MNGSLRATLMPLLRATLATARLFPTRKTAISDMQALISDLHPVRPQSPFVRLGPSDDGGYIIPDDLVGVAACFSPGVNNVSGFEKDCAARGMQVFLADRSVDGPAEHDDAFHFTKKFVGATSSQDYMTLDEWVAEANIDRDADLLLQMDIEGGEYEVILSTPMPLVQRFRIIVAEFHLLDQLWSKPFFSVASRAFGKVLQTHACVHVHPNNCCGAVAFGGLTIPRAMEFTFIRRDRIVDHSPRNDFPHPLDRDNFSNQPLALPRCWLANP